MRAKVYVFSILFLLSGWINSGFSAEKIAKAKSEGVKPNYHQSNWSVSATNIGIGYQSPKTVYMYFEPRVEYFVLDRLSVGAVLGASTTFDNLIAAWGGPSATLYLLDLGNVSLYTGASIIFSGLLDPQVDSLRNPIFSIHLGANYNFTDWFGVGPRLRYSTMVSQRTQSVTFELINLFFYF